MCQIVWLDTTCQKKQKKKKKKKKDDNGRGGRQMAKEGEKTEINVPILSKFSRNLLESFVRTVS